MNAPLYADRRRPDAHGLRQAITLLRLAEARACEVDLDLGVRITVALDQLVEFLRDGAADPGHAAAYCPACGTDLHVTSVQGITTLERRHGQPI